MIVVDGLVTRLRTGIQEKKWGGVVWMELNSVSMLKIVLVAFTCFIILCTHIYFVLRSQYIGVFLDLTLLRLRRRRRHSV